MDRKYLLLSALGLTFVLVGGAWVWLLRLVPPGPARSAVVVLLGVAVVGLYMSLLVNHIRKIFRGEKFWLHGLWVIGELLLFLVGFASLHQHLGIIDNTRPGSPIVHDFWLSAYFSVITFTTVGYGDMYPTGLGRALAALQGFSGYLVLGVLASTAASVLSPYSRAGSEGTGGGGDGEGKAQ